MLRYGSVMSGQGRCGARLFDRRPPVTPYCEREARESARRRFEGECFAAGLMAASGAPVLAAPLDLRDPGAVFEPGEVVEWQLWVGALPPPVQRLRVAWWAHTGAGPMRCRDTRTKLVLLRRLRSPVSLSQYKLGATLRWALWAG